MNLKNINAIILILLSLSTAGCNTFRTLTMIRGGERVKDINSSIHVPYSLIRDNIIVDVHINGSPETYKFLLDTGALNVIDSSVAERIIDITNGSIGLEDTTGERETVSLISLEMLSIADNVSVQNVASAILDLSVIEKYTGYRIDGILGSNTLRHFIISIDYESNTLEFLPSKWKPASADQINTIPIKQIMKNGFAPAFECSLDNLQTPCIIDTGFSGTLMVPSEYLNHQWKDKTSLGGFIYGGGLGVLKVSRFLLVNNMKIGHQINLKEVPAITIAREYTYIGKEILSHYKMILNYPGNMVTFIPKLSIPVKLNVPMAGFGVSPDDSGHIVVIYVAEKSPATDILKPGDRILSLNGISGTVENLSKIRNLIIDPQITKLQIEFNSSKRIKKITLLKRKLLPF